MLNFVNTLAGFSQSNLPPNIQEEYLDEEGKVDWHYVGQSLDKRISASSGNSALNTACGFSKFIRTENTNEVTFEEFSTLYAFGEFKNVRGWIGLVFARTGKLLTRKVLFKYLDRLRPQYVKVLSEVNEL